MSASLGLTTLPTLLSRQTVNTTSFQPNHLQSNQTSMALDNNSTVYDESNNNSTLYDESIQLDQIYKVWKYIHEKHASRGCYLFLNRKNGFSCILGPSPTEYYQYSFTSSSSVTGSMTYKTDLNKWIQQTPGYLQNYSQHREDHFNNQENPYNQDDVISECWIAIQNMESNMQFHVVTNLNRPDVYKNIQLPSYLNVEGGTELPWESFNQLKTAIVFDDRMNLSETCGKCYFNEIEMYEAFNEIRNTNNIQPSWFIYIVRLLSGDYKFWKVETTDSNSTIQYMSDANILINETFNRFREQQKMLKDIIAAIVAVPMIQHGQNSYDFSLSLQNWVYKQIYPHLSIGEGRHSAVQTCGQLRLQRPIFPIWIFQHIRSAVESNNFCRNPEIKEYVQSKKNSSHQKKNIQELKDSVHNSALTRYISTLKSRAKAYSELIDQTESSTEDYDDIYMNLLKGKSKPTPADIERYKEIIKRYTDLAPLRSEIPTLHDSESNNGLIDGSIGTENANMIDHDMDPIIEDGNEYEGPILFEREREFQDKMDNVIENISTENDIETGTYKSKRLKNR